LKRAATLLIAGLAFGGAAAAAPSAAAGTVSGCTFSYSVGSQWTGGYTAQLTVASPPSSTVSSTQSAIVPACTIVPTPFMAVSPSCPDDGRGAT